MVVTIIVNFTASIDNPFDVLPTLTLFIQRIVHGPLKTRRSSLRYPTNLNLSFLARNHGYFIK